MKKQQLFSLLGISVALIGGAVLVWQKSNQTLPQNQTKEEKIVENSDIDNPDTSDWKTYQNNPLKFSVKYPSAFRITDESTDSGRIVSFAEFDEKAKNLSGQVAPGYFSVISIYQWKDINDPDLKGGSWEGEKQYANFQDFLADSKNTSIHVIDETNIDGIKAYVLSMPGEIGYEAIMFEYNGGYYRISFPWVQKQLDENIKKEVLSSIRFTK